FDGHRHGANACAFSPDGKTVASTGPDETIRWWDRATGKEIRKATSREARAVTMNLPTRLAFTPDGKTLASATGDRATRLWDVATGKQRQGPEGHEGGIDSLALSPDGKTLASCSYDDHTVRLWDASTGRTLLVLRHPAYVRRAFFSPDGKRVVSGCGDGAIRVWDVATGTEVRTMRLSDPAQGEAPEQAWNLAPAPRGQQAVSLGVGFSGRKAGGRGHRLTTWDLASGERLGQGKAADDLLSTFSADGTLLAGHQGAGIVVREVATGKEILRLAVPAGADNFWYPLAFSPSGRVLAT